MSTDFAKFAKIILLATISAVVGSCAAYNDYLAKRPAKVMETESQLTQAGFRKVAIQTADQHSAVAGLQLERLNQYQSADGRIFWYADPKLCQCLFEGDQVAHDHYEELLKTQSDTAEYANSGRPQEVEDLSSFGDTFPTPVQGWPFVIYLGGPISPVGVAGTGSRGGAISSAGGFGVGAGVIQLGGGGSGGRISRR